jgi:hypothetical protein
MERSNGVRRGTNHLAGVGEAALARPVLVVEHLRDGVTHPIEIAAAGFSGGRR